MKKILLATTMIVGGASIAAAEVTLSGDARMGIVRPADDAATAFDENSQTEFTSRARVQFTLSNETDGGLSFGGSFRANNAGDAANGQAGSVFISGAFGKLEMGDVDGAAEGAVGDLHGVGLTGVGDFNEALYLSNNTSWIGNVDNESIRPTARYTYSAGAFTGMVSMSNPNNQGDIYSLGAQYKTDAFTVGLGYEQVDGNAALGFVDAKHLIASASATFSGVTVKAQYGRASTNDGVVAFNGGDEAKQYGVSAAYTMDALTVSGYYRAVDANIANVTTVDISAIGLGGAYDLGGGATVQGGVARATDDLANTSETLFDLGVAFTF